MKEQYFFVFLLIPMVFANFCTFSFAGEQESINSNQSKKGSESPSNRLAETTSPYLLQHQHNPVDWYPWGEEAFEAAREQNKPIFLSIGYSTCYWCHVMERECFEDQEVADWMNKFFISVKVDREERPDIDEIYMTAVQLITRGRGGWPISLFLEPDSLKPIWGGTYFPKDKFIFLMKQIQEKWDSDVKAIHTQADQIANAVISRLSLVQEAVPISTDVIGKGASSLLSKFDGNLGGFSGSPKFPMPMYNDFLMETSWDNLQVQEAVKKTLDSMFMGGMYDQVGGGFHRYSTDAKWLVPHFEKMLYDNGQLVTTYSRAFELTGEKTYAAVVEETLEYVDRELSAPEGGFFSAQDAETNHLEGETYLWRESQIKEALEQAGMSDEVSFALSLYGVDVGTNFQDPHHPEEAPTNVLFLTNHPKTLASKHNLSYQEFRTKVDSIDKALLAVRDTRDQPRTDDKIITAWNGMMIAGYANAGRIMKNNSWIERATEAANFILNEMRLENGKLLRTWRDGKGGAEAFLIDYASFIHGLLAIYRADKDTKVLEDAIALYEKARELFYVPSEGWYDTEKGKSDLFVRTRALSDGAIPAATSFVLGDQVDFLEFTGDKRYLEDALETIDSESQWLNSQPLAVIVAAKHVARLMKSHPEKFSSEPNSFVDMDSTVNMSCEPSTLELSAGESAKIIVTLEMETGWHVNANVTGNDYTIPLSFTPTNDSMELEVDWPKSELMTSGGETVAVFGSKVTIPITLRLKQEAKGNLSIMARWQSCDEKSCLAPEEKMVPCKVIVE